ncbi:MAG: phenylalanine--tRNA ligase beta subunit-related protein, partial [Planctomycetota bacterium]
NAVSLHTGLPISVVDLDLAQPPFRIDLAPADTRYVFNPSGQVIELKGLLCLFDGEGPCANAVKDSQRTKTHPGTLRTLSVIWGTRALPGRTVAALGWYKALLESVGGRVEDV